MYVKLKEVEALERSKTLTVRALNSDTPQEKHQKEVDASFWMGKAVAYTEIRMFLEENSELKKQVKHLLENIAQELIVNHSIAKLKGLDAQNYYVKDSFEDGVHAMKDKLLEVLRYQDDIVILEF